MTTKTTRIALACWVGLVFAGAARGASTRYVENDNCPGPGTGTLLDPFCSIQLGIDASVSGDEVLVAPGTYNETIDFHGKAITLRSSDGPQVTIIDATGLNDTVVRAVSAEGPDTVLQGFTITGGLGFVNAGGMLISQSSPTIRQCVFLENSLIPNPFASCAGGGMFVTGGSPTIEDCQFIRNTTGNLAQCGGSGGGIYNSNGSPTVKRCIFSANKATYGSGGGMRNSSGLNPRVEDCQFVANEAAFGGGMANAGGSPSIVNCVFKANLAGFGGAMDNGSSNPIIDGCIFSENTAGGRGGAMHNINPSNPVVINSVFVGNSVAGSSMWVGGGAIYNNYSSAPTITNCTFSGNSAGATGGAIFNFQGGSPVITNCSFSGNNAGISGGVMYSTSTTGCACISSPFLGNCILWGNSPDQVFDAENADTTMTFSDIQGGFSGTGNIKDNPLFIDPDGADNLIGTQDDDLRLRAGSPAIDAGDNALITVPSDLDGNPRFVDDINTPDTGNGTPPIVDMGAYEFQGTLIPTLSEWGLLVLALGISIAGTIVLGRRRRLLPYQEILG